MTYGSTIRGLSVNFDYGIGIYKRTKEQSNNPCATPRTLNSYLVNPRLALTLVSQPKLKRTRHQGEWRCLLLIKEVKDIYNWTQKSNKCDMPKHLSTWMCDFLDNESLLLLMNYAVCYLLGVFPLICNFYSRYVSHCCPFIFYFSWTYLWDSSCRFHL